MNKEKIRFIIYLEFSKINFDYFMRKYDFSATYITINEENH
jgi:hypothetical protein